MSELTVNEPFPGEKKADGFLRSDAFIMLCVYAVTLTLHILMTLCTTIFNLTPDEYSVTAVAAYINGLDWSPTVSTGGYYGYFQSLFYIPVFWVTDDPYLRYHLMLYINGVIMSFAPVIVYYLCRNWFRVTKPASLLFCAVCGLYPCYMLLTKYTWNETMCNILPWVFALIMYRSLKSHEGSSKVKQQLWAVLGGVTLVAAYATHGRMLALLAAGIVLELAVLLSMKKRIFSLTGFYVSIAAAFAADKVIKDVIQSALWLTDEGKTPTNTIEKMFTRITDIDGDQIGKLFDTLIGHFFYFISSTWGFGAVCMVSVITCIVMYFRRRKSTVQYDEKGAPVKGTGPFICDDDAIFLLYTFLSMGAIFAVSVAFKGTSSLLEARMDTVIYGRYTEVLYPVAILAALLMIYRGRLSVAQTFGALAAGSIINILTEIFAAPIVTGGERFVSAMILGIAPMRYGEQMKDLITDETFIKLIITSMSALFLFVILKLLRRDDRKMYLYFSLPLAGLLLYTNIYCYVSYTIPQSRNARSGAEYVSEAMDMLEGSGYDTVYCFALARERYVKAQFLYPESELRVITSFSNMKTLEERPVFIMADREDNLNIWLDEVYRVGDINANTHLYACTEEAAMWALGQGYEVSRCGITEYTGGNVPATSSVIRGEGRAVIPAGAAVYTNYFLIYTGGDYYYTVYGSGLEHTRVTLTAEKGAKDLDYEILEQTDSRLLVSFHVNSKTENVRFKLSSTGGDAEVTVNSLTFERESAEPLAELLPISDNTQ